MKKRKVFLGIAIVAVAISAAFATKANTRSVTYYYKSGTTCPDFVFDNPPCSGTTGTCQYNFGSGLQTVYEDLNCTVVLPKQ